MSHMPRAPGPPAPGPGRRRWAGQTALRAVPVTRFALRRRDVPGRAGPRARLVSGAARERLSARAWSETGRVLTFTAEGFGLWFLPPAGAVPASDS